MFLASSEDSMSLRSEVFICRSSGNQAIVETECQDHSWHDLTCNSESHGAGNHWFLQGGFPMEDWRKRDVTCDLHWFTWKLSYIECFDCFDFANVVWSCCRYCCCRCCYCLWWPRRQEARHSERARKQDKTKEQELAICIVLHWCFLFALDTFEPQTVVYLQAQSKLVSLCYLT